MQMSEANCAVPTTQVRALSAGELEAVSGAGKFHYVEVNGTTLAVGSDGSSVKVSQTQTFLEKLLGLY
jgi:hypothetical protein